MRKRMKMIGLLVALCLGLVPGILQAQTANVWNVYAQGFDDVAWETAVNYDIDGDGTVDPTAIHFHWDDAGAYADYYWYYDVATGYWYDSMFYDYGDGISYEFWTAHQNYDGSIYGYNENVVDYTGDYYDFSLVYFSDETTGNFRYDFEYWSEYFEWDYYYGWEPATGAYDIDSWYGEDLDDDDYYEYRVYSEEYYDPVDDEYYYEYGVRDVEADIDTWEWYWEIVSTGAYESGYGSRWDYYYDVDWWYYDSYFSSYEYYSPDSGWIETNYEYYEYDAAGSYYGYGYYEYNEINGVYYYEGYYENNQAEYQYWTWGGADPWEEWYGSQYDSWAPGNYYESESYSYYYCDGYESYSHNISSDFGYQSTSSWEEDDGSFSYSFQSEIYADSVYLYTYESYDAECGYYDYYYFYEDDYFYYQFSYESDAITGWFDYYYNYREDLDDDDFNEYGYSYQSDYDPEDLEYYEYYDEWDIDADYETGYENWEQASGSYEYYTWYYGLWDDVNLDWDYYYQTEEGYDTDEGWYWTDIWSGYDDNFYTYEYYEENYLTGAWYSEDYYEDYVDNYYDYYEEWGDVRSTGYYYSTYDYDTQIGFWYAIEYFLVEGSSTLEAQYYDYDNDVYYYMTFNDSSGLWAGYYFYTDYVADYQEVLYYTDLFGDYKWTLYSGPVLLD